MLQLREIGQVFHFTRQCMPVTQTQKSLQVTCLIENLIQKVEAMDSRVPPNKTYPVCISIIHIQYVSSNMLFLLGNFGASPSAIRIAFCHVM
jgi:hypothetical protein